MPDGVKDKNLAPLFHQQASTQKRISRIRISLEKFLQDQEIINDILCDLSDEFIPAGTKGNIQGNQFNFIIRNRLQSEFSSSLYTITFETKSPYLDTDENPDWCVKNDETNRSVIGYNQIDLWSGGAQSNRGYKYIMNDTFHENHHDVKILSVICAFTKIFSTKTKKFNLFSKGFQENRLCYTGNLIEIIKNFIDEK